MTDPIIAGRPEAEDNLAATIKQASRRARAYRLADDGASDLARRKRALRESVANRKLAIKDLQGRQAGEEGMSPLDPDMADRILTAHQEAIVELKLRLQDAAPTAGIIAPMTRRVAREDRRRARKEARRGRN